MVLYLTARMRNGQPRGNAAHTDECVRMTNLGRSSSSQKHGFMHLDARKERRRAR